MDARIIELNINSTGGWASWYAFQLFLSKHNPQIVVLCETTLHYQYKPYFRTDRHHPSQIFPYIAESTAILTFDNLFLIQLFPPTNGLKSKVTICPAETTFVLLYIHNILRDIHCKKILREYSEIGILHSTPS